MKVTIFTDGASRGNPGKAAAGYVVGKVHEGRYLGAGLTNNAAEYLALLHALAEAERQGADEVEIFSDSLLMVNQINRVWRTNDILRAYWTAAVHTLRHRFKYWTLSHIPRERNKEADRLVNEVLDQNAAIIRSVD